MMNNKNKIIYVLVVCIILVVVFFVYRHFSAILKLKNAETQQAEIKKDNLISFSFYPEKILVFKGEDFKIDVMIDPKKHNVSNADLVFSYDKTKMRLDSISQSDQFSQVLSSFVSTEEGKANFSAATGFDSALSLKATYAILHFHALEKAENISILIDEEKSGIYGDDNPGANILESSSPVLISIVEKSN